MKVVAGILKGKDGRIFAAQKAKMPGSDPSLPTQWEFPGGKVEDGEDLITALKREWLEEFHVEILAAKELGQVEIPTKKMEIHFFFCSYRGFLRPTEHRAFTWLHPGNHQSFDFCPADAAFLAAHLESLVQKQIQR